MAYRIENPTPLDGVPVDALGLPLTGNGPSGAPIPEWMLALLVAHEEQRRAWVDSSQGREFARQAVAVWGD